MSEYRDLAIAWQEAKQQEIRAVELRRKIEDELIRMIGMPESFEGTVKHEAIGYEIKLVGRMNRKVDGDKLQEIAAENGLSEHLGTLFRWKPEIDAKAWKSADGSITTPLSAAITTTPGRPTLTITELVQEEV